MWSYLTLLCHFSHLLFLAQIFGTFKKCKHIKYTHFESERKWKWSRSVMSDSLRPMDCSPPSSSFRGILQARILEWVTISFSRGSSWLRDSPGKNTGVGWFSRQEYWSGLPFPSPEDLPDPGIKPRSPTLQADALTSALPGKPLNTRIQVLTSKISREERKPGWKKREEAGKGRRKGWPYRRLLPPTDAQALWDFSLGLQRTEDWNLALSEIRPDQKQNSSSLPRGGDQSPILSSG